MSMSLTVIEKIYSMAKSPNSALSAAETCQLKILEGQIQRGYALVNSFLPIEREAINQAWEVLIPIRKQWRQLKRRQANLKKLNADCLALVKEVTHHYNYPALAIFNLNYQKFWVSKGIPHFLAAGDFNPHSATETQVLKAPEPLHGYYKGFNDHYSFHCRFQGVVPVAIKQKIGEYRPIFEEIYLLTETNLVSLNTYARHDDEAHVVGYDDGQLWLIDSFDSSISHESLNFTLPSSSEES